MFDLDPGDDLDLLIETTRQFARDALLPHLRDHEAARGVNAAVAASFAEIGLARLEWPEEQGGAALGSLARALVNEELAAADPGAALALDPLGPAFAAIHELGGDAALAEFGEPVFEAGGRAVLVVADDATLEARDGRLSGRVPWVPADRVELAVYLDADGASLVREGLEAVPLRGSGLRAAGAAELRLAEAPVLVRLEGAAGARRALARARLYAASLLVGVLRHTAEFSREYALEREAFGRPIAHHQGLAFLITDMEMAVEGARLLVHDAAWRLDRGQGAAGEAAAAFAETIDAARLVGPNGVQILGGHGFMADYPMEKAMREARALGLWLGGGDAARDEAGRALEACPLPVELSAMEGA